MIRTGSFLLVAWILSSGLAEGSEVRDLLYYDGPDRDDQKHRLDLYLPDSKSPVPVLMFIHGGGWKFGDRWQYPLLGRQMAKRGFAFAAISYRLSPGVKHPEHIKDCARAFAWLYRNVAKYGGDPQQMFVMGHSAGGHLTALLALDSKWIEAQGVPAGSIRGAIPISGVLEVPDPGKEPKSSRNMFQNAFGQNKALRREANPINHIKGSDVPLLVITELFDPGLLRPWMYAFRKEARRQGRKDIQYMNAARGHISIIVLMIRRCDPVQERVVDFIRRHAGER